MSSGVSCRACRPSARIIVFASLLTLAGARFVEASTIAVGIGAFGPGSTLTTFSGIPVGNIDGRTIDGILYDYAAPVGSIASVASGGPNDTNNITQPGVLSTGPTVGILTLLLPSFIDTFGYGYAVLNTAPIPNATTISLFAGAVNVGSMSYNGVPDPIFAGGFAGIQSTIPFNQVTISFAPGTLAFDIDNVRTGTGQVPEPASLLLFSTGVALLARARRRTAAPLRR